MTILEPRCMVCGSPLGRDAIFEKSARNSEVCSDECYKVFSFDQDGMQEQIDRLKEINRELVNALEQANADIEEEWGRGSDLYQKVLARAKEGGAG